MSRRSASTETVIAYHEAGHAVAALRLGVPVRHVTIDPENDDGGIVLGHVRFRSGDKDPPSLGHRLLVISLAGPAAQRRYAPRSPVRVNGASDFAHAQRESELCSSDPMAARSLHHWGEREARHLVAREWWLVERIADILIRRRTISGDELQEALAPIEAARESVAEDYRRYFLKSPDQVQAAVDEHADAWRRMRKVRRSDVAAAMLRVMTDVLALGDHIELSKITAATIFNLVAAGFDEDVAREKVEALIAERAPFVGWKPLTDAGRLTVSGGPGGTGDARPAHLSHHDDGGEHAAA